MEFVVRQCPSDTTVATGPGGSFVLGNVEIRDEQQTVIAKIEKCDKQPAKGTLVEYSLKQNGVITATFTIETNSPSKYFFTYDGQTMPVHPLHHFVCEEIHARTEIPWFPPGQFKYVVDDGIDPVCALFLFQMLEMLDESL